MTKNMKKGFTLIELMVVMAIIAVLAVLMIGAIQLARSTATETTHRANAKTIQTALEGNFAKYKVYCGGTSPVTCTTGTATTPFSTIAGLGQLNVALGSASTASTCAVGTAAVGTLGQPGYVAATNPSANAGGGRVSVMQTTYSIIPVVSNCTGSGTTTTVAPAGDLSSDVLSVQ
jgi:prepilin-type N-terminal cleavage/methylation domain-containing protein